MKTKICVVLLLILGLALLTLVAAQTSNSAGTNAAPAQQNSSSASQQKTEKSKKVHLPPNFSADDVYKQNCTRCHSEVPKLDPKRTNTIVRHMRVRGNLTKDEADAILKYLTE